MSSEHPQPREELYRRLKKNEGFVTEAGIIMVKGYLLGKGYSLKSIKDKIADIQEQNKLVNGVNWDFQIGRQNSPLYLLRLAYLL